MWRIENSLKMVEFREKKKKNHAYSFVMPYFAKLINKQMRRAHDIQIVTNHGSQITRKIQTSNKLSYIVYHTRSKPVGTFNRISLHV